MSHVRQQIRDAAYTLLTGLNTTGANVFKSRLYPLNETELPGLCIYTNAEEPDDEQGKFDVFDVRRLTLSVEGHGKLVTGLEDQLDDMAGEVEDAILTPGQDFGGLAQTVDIGTVEYGKSKDGDQPVGIVIVNFIVTYYINRGTSGTAL